MNSDKMKEYNDTHDKHPQISPINFTPNTLSMVEKRLEEAGWKIRGFSQNELIGRKNDVDNYPMFFEMTYEKNKDRPYCISFPLKEVKKNYCTSFKNKLKWIKYALDKIDE